MDTKRHRTVSPVDLGGKDVFIINDIDLTIPPTQIEIRKEDLTFRYRTLRSKVATKLPTGHGQISVHLSIPFTKDTFLTLHRLIVEINNSPFCYMDNRYLRESIVPDWPYSQAMAFTVTGLNLANMPNSSDSFVLELDATWFNYFPFMHNFLFREEWQTNWLREGEGVDTYLKSFTIGWNLNQTTLKREYYPNPIADILNMTDSDPRKARDSDVGGQSVQDSWSLVQNKFVDSSRKRTIYEMEQNHPGTIWDLLPLPGNMRPSNIVAQPKNSRIYVRYINFLQRDALLKNFGIDVEADIKAWEDVNFDGISQGLFKVGLDRDNLPTVFSLDSRFVPKVLRHKWINTMRSFNHGIKFHFHGYKEIRMPQKWTDDLDNRKNNAISDLFSRLNALRNLDKIREGDENGSESAIPVLGAKYPINSPFGRRLHPVLEREHQHTGVDYGAPRGTPIYAPEDGVTYVVRNNEVSGNYVTLVGETYGKWQFLHMDLVSAVEGERVAAGTFLGTVGNTGRTTRIRPDGTTDNTRGYHLHLQFKPTGASTWVDPIPYLSKILEDSGVVETPQEEESLTINEPYFDYSDLTENSVELTEEERIESLIKSSVKQKLELTEEESGALQELLDVLAAEGWSYYDDDVTVTNIWKKLFTVEINHSGLNAILENSEVSEDFRQKGIIMTSVSGSLSHIVSRIPILSHEFPTHQHLGSIEPEYQIEFAVLDDQSNLEGISAIAQMVQGMRSVLQSNARKFRPVIDGWCVATDTFITRLFGSYVGGVAKSQGGDFTIYEDGGFISDIQVKKRCIVSSSYEGTVPGNPGLSTISLNLQETNPYEQEVLVSTASTLNDKENSREKVLRAIHDLNLKPEYKDLLLPILLAQKVGANLTDMGAADFGKFGLRQMRGYFTGDTIRSEDVFFYRKDSNDLTSDPLILVRSSGPDDLDFYKAIGADADYYYNHGNRTDFIQIDPTGLDSWFPTDLNNTLALPTRKIEDPELKSLKQMLNPTGFSMRYYDVGELVTNNPELSIIPVQQILDFHSLITNSLKTGYRLFAEEEVGGLSKNLIETQLYNLPVRTDMWKGWQMYLEEWAKISNLTNAGTAIRELLNASRTWKESLPEEDRAFYASITNEYYGIFRSPTADFGDFFSGPVDAFVSAVHAGVSSDYSIIDLFRERHKQAITRLVNRYMTSFPIKVFLSEDLKKKYDYLFGELLGNFSDNERGKVPALDSMHIAFEKNATSCGSITYDYISNFTNRPVWQSKDTLDGSLSLGSQAYTFQALANPLSILDADPAAVQKMLDLTPGNPFTYPTDQGTEQLKVRYIKQLLSGFADDILGNFPVLEALGLDHLMFQDENRDYQGLECYPDLALPSHPYYQSKTQTSPDFYMWNIYEDGGALGPEQLGAIQEQVNSVLDNCYESMKRMERGDTFDERRDTYIPEVSVDDPMVITTQISAEGTDGSNNNGTMASPFYPTSKSKSSVDKWKDEAVKSKQPAAIYSDKPSEYMRGVRLSNLEGLFGNGGGAHYPKRVGSGTYLELKSRFDETKQLFGSSEGYLNTQLDTINTPEISSSIKGTNLERPREAGVFFDKDSLKDLARDSSKDLISHKMSLKRAFPTFKLYFVEEDEFETRFINFDDFYSYNAVKDVRVVMNRKLAADHAVITLQNISGTLDGTRRNALVDLDYFSNDAKKKIDSHNDVDSSSIAGDPITTNTSSDQPFGSVVLRPGLNVQLRMGFSNDPNNLHVMLSGRIVDVTWNKTGDLAEIMIQSFGTELEQVIKGTYRDEHTRTFSTTHELLGSMMMEPEVAHFGRWEFGQLFQIGEAKDHRLDFTEYSREGYMGRFGVTNWLSQWIMNHPRLVLGAMVGLTAANLLPLGKPIGVAGKKAGGFLNFIGNRLGATGIGKRGYRALFSGVRTGEEALEFTARTKAFGAAGETLEKLAKSAATRIGAKEFDDVLASKVDEAIALFYKAANVDEAAEAAVKLERFIQMSVFKSKWMAKPWMEIGDAKYWTAFGFRPVGTLINLYTGTPFKVGLTAFAGAVAIDAIIDNVLRPVKEYTIGGARKFFARTNVQLFLSPQDDNLFPPHPKDYMNLDKSIGEKVFEVASNALGTIFTGDATVGESINRFWFPNRYMDKKVDPKTCEYRLTSTTIWSIFHEMSLRHPGWIYGARPYGNSFRYTMFFGLPAQRYWARGATNGFITRANQLRRFLDNRSENFSNTSGLISEQEFRLLYGDDVLNELKRLNENTNDLYQLPIDFTVDSNDAAFIRNNASSDIVGQQAIREVIDRRETAVVEKFQQARLNNQMTAIAIQEYLKAVEIRFEPFRRYHLLTSERDIVWNGIMGSEQAVTNAVDVTYFPSPSTRDDDANNQVKTSIFKAHSFIPEYKLRIAPVRWYNCIGYQMAMRYGMGELVHRMRDMYRGELILLGNPRIRPWDVGILVDSYNDMVGPIEVEQVVHTFSHETGFLTEIKPSAVVFANEISGWPMIEAMKIYALAVHDIHNRWLGIRAIDNDSGPGSLATVANVIANIPGQPALTATGAVAAGPIGAIAANVYGSSIHNGKKFDSYIEEKYKKLFGTEGAQLSDMFGAEPPPKLDSIDRLLSDIAQSRISSVGIAGAGLTLAGAAISGRTLLRNAGELVLGDDGITNIPTLNKVPLKDFGKIFKKNPLALAAGAALLATGGVLGGSALLAPLIINQFDFPGLAFLVGNSVLFLQCLRNDAIIVVPLTKSGNPIIAGLAYNDPAMIWKNFRGQLNRMATDTIEGTTDMISLYKRYGSALWERMNDKELGIASGSPFGTPDAPSLNSLTGESSKGF